MNEFSGDWGALEPSSDWHTIADVARQTDQGLLGHGVINHLGLSEGLGVGQGGVLGTGPDIGLGTGPGAGADSGFLAERAAGHLGMTIGEEELLLPADMDTDSTTVATADGMSIFADTDGDGQIDYVSNVSFDGHWSAWRWLGEGEARGVGQPEQQAPATDLGGGRPNGVEALTEGATSGAAQMRGGATTGGSAGNSDAAAAGGPAELAGGATATGSAGNSDDAAAGGGAAGRGDGTGVKEESQEGRKWNIRTWKCVDRGEWG